MIFKTLSSETRLKKIISSVVAFSFLLSNIAFAETPKSNITPDAKKPTEVVTDPEKIVISRDYGLVKSKFTGKDKRLVIHIQDAHCNYEAQSNIAKILESLIKNDGLSLVSVEGADGFIDTSWFKAFPDADIRKEVADYFMKKGEITGPELLSITTDYPIKLFGAETRSYYIENLNAFTTSYPLKEDTERYFNQIKAIVNKLKTNIYSAELKDLDSRMQDYEAKKMQFADYVKFLETLAQKHKINLRQYENIFKLVSVFVYEKRIDFKIVDKERSALIDELTKKLDKDALADLVTKSLSFKTNKISSVEYYDYLKKLAAHHGFDLMKDYPNLANYIIYNSVYSRIENEKLFNDIKNLELAIKEKLFANDDQRTLEKLSRHIDILLGLTNIKLLNGDFDYYKTHKEEFTHEVFADFIKKMAAKYGFAFELDNPSDAVKESLPKLEDFYAIAIKRDKALVDNTLQAMKKESAQVCVLVTGGFHSEGITKLLEQQGLSYMVICPNITKDVETPYIKVLTNQRTPLEEILTDTPAVDAKTKQGMLAPILATWAAPLDEAQIEKLFSDIPFGRISKADLQKLIAGIIARMSDVKIDFERRSIEEWIEKALNVAYSHRYGRDIKAMQDAFTFSMRVGLIARKVRLSPAEKNAIDRFVKALTGSKDFSALFTEVYENAFQRYVVSQGPNVRALREFGNTPDRKRQAEDRPMRYSASGANDSRYAKTSGGTLSNAFIGKVIKKRMEDPNGHLVIFENGKISEALRNDPVKSKRYKPVIDILKAAIRDLNPEIFSYKKRGDFKKQPQHLREGIFRSPHITGDHSDIVAKAIGKNALVKLLKKGSNFRIVLIEGQAFDDDEQEVNIPGVRCPAIALTPDGTNYGHYSHKPEENSKYPPSAYLPWGAIDEWLDTIESKGVDNPEGKAARGYIAGDSIHEVSERVALRGAFPDVKNPIQEFKIEEPETMAHYIAQYLEIELLGHSPKDQEFKLGPRSPLDDELDRMTEVYLDKAGKVLKPGVEERMPDIELPEGIVIQIGNLQKNGMQMQSLKTGNLDNIGESTMITLINKERKQLHVEVIRLRVGTEVMSFCKIGNRTYQIIGHTINLSNLFRIGTAKDILAWLGNKELMDFFGLSTYDVLREEANPGSVGAERYFWDTLHEPISRIAQTEISPYDVTPEDLDEARKYLKAAPYSKSASFEEFIERLHYIAVLSRSNVNVIKDYSKIVEDIKLVTENITKLAVNTNVIIQDIAREIFNSISVAVVRTAPTGDARKSRLDLTPQQTKKLNKREPFILENDGDFDRLRDIAEKQILDGNLKPYVLINIKNFAETTFISYINFLSDLSEKFNGNITFILSVENPLSLQGDLAGTYTARRRAIDIFGDDFWLKEKIITMPDGGEKKRAADAGVLAEQWSRTLTSDGIPFAEDNILTGAAAWLTLPKLGMGRKGQNYKVWLASDGRIRFGKANWSGKPLSEIPDDLQLAAFGVEALVMSQDQLNYIRQEVLNEASKQYKSPAEVFREVLEKILLTTEIGEAIRLNMDRRELTKRGIFVTDKNGIMPERGFLEKGGGDKLPLIERYLNTAALAYEYGGKEFENLWFIVEDSKTSLDITKRFATTETDIPLEAHYIGRVNEVSTFQEVFQHVLAGTTDRAWANQVRQALTSGKIYGLSYGEGVYAQDIASIENYFNMWQEYVRDYTGPKEADVDISPGVTIAYRGDKNKIKYLLRNVKICGAGVLEIGDGVVIQGGTIYVDGKLSPSDRSIVVDCELFAPVEFIGEGVALVGVRFDPNRYVLRDRYMRLHDKLTVYGDETTTTQTYTDGNTYVVRFINSFDYSKVKICDMVGGKDKWEAIKKRLYLPNAPQFKRFEDVFRMPLKDVVKSEDQWIELVEYIYTPTLSAEELNKIVAQIKSLSGRFKSGIINEAALKDGITDSIKSAVSARFTATDIHDFDRHIDEIIQVVKGHWWQDDLEGFIKRTFESRARPQIDNALQKIHYEDVKDEPYGKALYRILAVMHPAIINNVDHGPVSWDNISRSGDEKEFYDLPLYGAGRSHAQAKADTDSFAMAWVLRTRYVPASAHTEPANNSLVTVGQPGSAVMESQKPQTPEDGAKRDSASGEQDYFSDGVPVDPAMWKRYNDRTLISAEGRIAIRGLEGGFVRLSDSEMPAQYIGVGETLEKTYEALKEITGRDGKDLFEELSEILSEGTKLNPRGAIVYPFKGSRPLWAVTLKGDGQNSGVAIFDLKTTELLAAYRINSKLLPIKVASNGGPALLVMDSGNKILGEINLTPLLLKEYFSNGVKVNWSRWRYGRDLNELRSLKVSGQTAKRGVDGKFNIEAGKRDSASGVRKEGMKVTKANIEAQLQFAINGNMPAYAAIEAMPKAALIKYFEADIDKTIQNLPEDLFGFGNGYDVRGNAQPVKGGNVDLTPKNVYAIGKLRGTYYANTGDKVLLTGDIRMHTPILRYVMALGYASVGVNVDYSMDFLTTGGHILLATENTEKYKNQDQVSGSHGIPQKQGLKMKADLGKGILEPLYAERLEGLYWKIKPNKETGAPGVRQLEVRKDAKLADIKQITGLQDRVVEMLDKTLPPILKDEIIVNDCRAGTAGPTAVKLYKKRGFEIIDMDKILDEATIKGMAENKFELNKSEKERLFAQIAYLWVGGRHKIAVMLNMTPDAEMKRGIWDPSKPEALVPTQALVKAINEMIAAFNKSQTSTSKHMPKTMGGVYDGDGDRVTAILEDGTAISSFDMPLPFYQRFLVDPLNRKAIISIARAGGLVKLTCDVRANSRLLKLIDKVNKELQDESGIHDRDLIEGWYITTGYPPQTDFPANRIKELDNFIDSKPELKNDAEFMANFEHLKRTTFTAEASGHNFFHTSPTYPHRVCDDGIAGFITFVSIRETMPEYEAPALGLKMGDGEAKYLMTDLFGNFPRAYSSEEVRVIVPNAIKIATAHKIGAWMKDEYGTNLKSYKEAVKEGDYLLQGKDEGLVVVAGYKIQLKDGRTALVRWSNTDEKLTTIFEGSDLKSLISIIKEITERLREETVNGVDVSDLDKEIARLGSLAARQSSSGVGIDVDWPSFARAIDGDTWKRMPEVISTMTTKTGLWENFVDGGKLMLGWMNLSEWREKDNIMPPMREFAAQVRAEKKEGKTTDIVFVGQGGSIEGIKTLYRILGADKDSAAVHTMDTVDNEVISDLKKLPLETTRFVILSKSMTTMEVHSFYKLFYDLYVAKGIQNAKNHFTLVTDQEKAEVKNGVLTVSEKVREPFRTEALTRGFYNVFYIEPCSGGRYSWDTAIGILPALIMGQDVDKILEGARNVEELVKNTDLRENPMAQYGAFKYGMHQKGRNRPTLMLPDEIMPYGPWDGQLDTESVGKTSAQSSLTIDHEKPAEDLRVYTDKRFFVRIKLGHRDFRLDSKVADLEKAGFPVYTITLTNSAPGNVNPKDLGALLKMSEFATVIAGYLMGETTEKVNPVNQPGVEEYKKASQLYIAESYVENPKFVAVTKTGNVKLDYRASVENKGKITQKSLNEILKRLGRTAKNDVAARYAALLYLSAKKHRRDYNAMMIFKRLSLNPELGRILDEWRYGVRDTLWVDTLGEEAPCILHAKQQGFQKGEPSGNFTVVRFAKYKGEDIVIPGSEETYGQPKTFEDLIKALAIGALEALSNAVEIDENNREVPVNRLGVMIELKDETPETVAEFGKIVNETIALLSELVKRDQGNQAIIDHMVANEVMEGTGLGRFSASGHVTMLAERYRPALSSLIERMSGHVVELLKTDVNDTRGSITIKSEDIAFPAVFEYSIVGENIVVNYLGIQEDILVPILSYIANVHSVNSLLVRDAMPYHDEGEYISHLAQKDYMGYPGYNEKLKGTDTLFTGKLISLITSAPESTQPARARSSASGQTIDEAAEAIANLLIDSENRDNVRGAVAILNDTKELPGFEKETFLALVTSKVEKKTAGNVPNDLAAFTSYVNDTPGRFSASGKAVEFEPVKLLNAEEISAVTAEDIEALESTLLSLGTNKEALAKDGKVMIIWDTAISDTATNAVAQQTAKLIDKRLGEGAAINIRGNGTNSAKLLGEVQKYLGSENIRAIITIAGDKTLKADAPMGGTVEEALQKLHERSKVLNVQSKDAEGNPLFIQVPALYNLALSIGYEMPQDKIIQCLQNIGIVIDDNGKPIDPMSILTEKIVRILPRIRPVDMNADAEAQTLARKAVEHSV